MLYIVKSISSMKIIVIAQEGGGGGMAARLQRYILLGVQLKIQAAKIQSFSS